MVEKFFTYVTGHIKICLLNKKNKKSKQNNHVLKYYTNDMRYKLVVNSNFLNPAYLKTLLTIFLYEI